MTLDDLSVACKPNFVWLKLKTVTRKGEITDIIPTRVMQTDPELEISENLALIIFTGLGLMYGFDKHDIIDYLACEENDFNQYHESYKNHMAEAFTRYSTGINFKDRDEDNVDLTKKVWVKAGLVSNVINFKEKYGRVSLRDFNNV